MRLICFDAGRRQIQIVLIAATVLFLRASSQPCLTSAQRMLHPDSARVEWIAQYAPLTNVAPAYDQRLASGPGDEAVLTTCLHSPNVQCQLISFTASGEVQWVQTLAMQPSWSWQANSTSPCRDGAGNIYVAEQTGGGYWGPPSWRIGKYDRGGTLLWTTPQDAASWPCVLRLDTAGRPVVFLDQSLLRYDENGGLRWSVKITPDSGSDQAFEDVALDAAGNVYLSTIEYGTAPVHLVRVVDPEGRIRDLIRDTTGYEQDRIVVLNSGRGIARSRDDQGSVRTLELVDSGGTRRWSRALDARIADMKTCPGDLILLSGIRNDVSGGALVLKAYDTTGSVLWEVPVGPLTPNQLGGNIIVHDGGTMSVLWRDPGSLPSSRVFRVDDSGRIIATTELTMNVTDMQAGPGGTLWVTGSSSQNRAVVVQLRQDGSIAMSGQMQEEVRWSSAALSAMDIDAEGNVYVAGDGGIQTNTGTVSGNILTALTTNGSRRWTIPCTSTGRLLVDGSSAVYAGNARYDTAGQKLWGFLPSTTLLGFDASGNTYGLTPRTDNDNRTFARYDPLGNMTWLGNVETRLSAAAVDPTGHTYRTYPWPGTSGSNDFVVVKRDARGMEIWTAMFNGPGSLDDTPTQLRLDTSNNVYVAGWTGPDAVVIKYRGDDGLDWVTRHAAGVAEVFGRTMSLAVSPDGHSTVLLSAESSADGSSSSEILHVAPDGTISWIQRIPMQAPSALATDGEAAAYVATVSGTTSRLNLRLTKFARTGDLEWQSELADSLVDAAATLRVDRYGGVYLGCTTAGNLTKQTVVKYRQPTSASAASYLVSGNFALQQNYPNPFNPSTVISYQLPVVSNVKLAVYDMLGREVRVLVDEKKEAGYHEIRFDGSGLASGVYLYRLRAGDYVATKKLLLMK
jgi:hypothetical protein